MFPAGFQDPQWLAKTRGEGAKRHLKRHRNRVISDAKEMLGKENLDRLLMEHKATEIVEAAESIMSRTDLVTAAQLKPFSSVTPKNHPELAKGIQEFLYGSHGDAERVTAWVQLLTRGDGYPAGLAAGHGPAGLGARRRACARAPHELSGPGSLHGSPGSPVPTPPMARPTLACCR